MKGESVALEGETMRRGYKRFWRVCEACPVHLRGSTTHDDKQSAACRPGNSLRAPTCAARRSMATLKRCC